MSLPCVDDLKDNEESVFKAACDTLLRVSTNIMKNPTEQRFRSLKLTSTTIATKLMIAAGGMECLFAMGFKESPSDSEALVLPMDDSLDELRRIHDQVESLKRSKIEARGGSTGDVLSAQSTSSQSSIPSASFPSSRPTQAPSSTTASTPTSSSSSSSVSPISAAMLRSELSFRRRLESGIQTVRAYEDPRLQSKALACVPLDRLRREAQALHDSMSASTADAESGNSAAAAAAVPDVGIEDCLMLLLIWWFKREFFKWVNQPNCENCDGKTTGSGMGTPSDAEAMWGAGRVELYKCSSCNHVTRFPRYNHPGKLLETRRGRCGEWANCFALVSRACDFETRYVLDWTDHVWTEYFSKSQDRWVHGDTCEEGHDKPLLYEHGWGKKLTYVIAFSVDDVQDVTWRYTTKQADVLRRREEIRENVLVSTIMQMRTGLQASAPLTRKNELTRRTIIELADFIGCDQRVVTKGELSGRQSGSLSWRLSRGETGMKQLQAEGGNSASASVAGSASASQIQLIPTQTEIVAKRFNLKYYPVEDVYRRENGSESSSSSSSWSSSSSSSSSGWRSLAYETNDLMLKKEEDWRMTYLARSSDCGHKQGSISWRLNLKGARVKMKRLELVISQKVFENGKIDWIVCCDGECQKIIPSEDQKVPLRLDLDGSDYLEVKAVLSGGTGDNAWQHAQLFRSCFDEVKAVGLDVTVYFL